MAWIVNSPLVISERFENEVIVIHLEKGNYYSLRDTAADIWTRLAAGQTLAEVESSHTERFGPDSQAPLHAFVAQLQEHELLREGEPTRVDFTPVTVASYVPPKLDIYTDMQELLLLDPVHDVDETGWPSERKA